MAAATNNCLLASLEARGKSLAFFKSGRECKVELKGIYCNITCSRD